MNDDEFVHPSDYCKILSMVDGGKPYLSIAANGQLAMFNEALCAEVAARFADTTRERDAAACYAIAFLALYRYAKATGLRRAAEEVHDHHDRDVIAALADAPPSVAPAPTHAATNVAAAQHDGVIADDVAALIAQREDDEDLCIYLQDLARSAHWRGKAHDCQVLLRAVSRIRALPK